MGHDDDLYGDLPEGTTSDYIAEIENKLKICQEKYDESQKLIKGLENEKHHYQIQINELQKKVENLEKNISSLYKTAITEVKRKEKMLNELQMEADSLAFRRKKFSDRSANCSRGKARDHRDVYDKYYDEDGNLTHDKYAHTSNDRQHNYCKKNEKRSHELVDEKYGSFDRGDYRKERHYIKRSRKEIPVSDLRNSLDVRNNSYKTFRELPAENRIDRRSGSSEDKYTSFGRKEHQRNGSHDEKSRTAENRIDRRSESSENKYTSFGRNEHRRNGSHDDKSRAKTSRSCEERLSTKSSDQAAEISLSGLRDAKHEWLDYDLQKTSMENKERHPIKSKDRAEISLSSLYHDPKGQNIFNNSNQSHDYKLYKIETDRHPIKSEDRAEIPLSSSQPSSIGQNIHNTDQSHDHKSQKTKTESKDKHPSKSYDRTEIPVSSLHNHQKVQNTLNNSNKTNTENKEKHPIKPHDRAQIPVSSLRNDLKEQNIPNNSNKTNTENKEKHPIKPHDRAEIPVSSLRNDLKEQNIPNNWDKTSNKTLNENPTESILEEMKNSALPYQVQLALFSMEKRSFKLITPMKETPDCLKQKYSHFENNKTTIKIPMINEQRMLSPFKNVGRVEIVSRCADETEPPKSTSSEVAAACSVTVSEDIEHGVFSRKNRKRPRVQNIVIDVKKVVVSS